MPEKSIIIENFINFNPSSSGKREVIDEMSGLFASHGRLGDAGLFIENVLEREAVSSTNTGIGVAIPHGKGAFVETSSAAIFRFDDGLNWDGDDVKVVIMLAVADDEEGLAHLEVIAAISTILMDDDFLDLMFNTKTEKRLFDEILKRLEEEL